jgi:hypothetical protein
MCDKDLEWLVRGTPDKAISEIARLTAALAAATRERDELAGANLVNRNAVRLQKEAREAAESALATIHHVMGEDEHSDDASLVEVVATHIRERNERIESLTAALATAEKEREKDRDAFLADIALRASEYDARLAAAQGAAEAMREAAAKAITPVIDPSTAYDHKPDGFYPYLGESTWEVLRRAADRIRALPLPGAPAEGWNKDWPHCHSMTCGVTGPHAHNPKYAPAEGTLTAFDKAGADRLAVEVEKLIERHVIDSRSPAADALLDYRDGNIQGPHLTEEPAEGTGTLTADDVEWVVNDLAELGVKIGAQFFWLYKGESLTYGNDHHTSANGVAIHDDGKPMHWRPVFKREFGECCHPYNLKDPTKYGTVSLDDSDEWELLPAPSPQREESGTTKEEG